MLSYMRRNAGSWIIKVMLIGIALTFVIGFGILPTLKDREAKGSVVAKVGDRLITRVELDQAYQRLVQVYQQMYKDRLSDEVLKQLRLRETALNSLVNNALQLEEARTLHIDVTSQELQAWIQSLPYFQRDGRFSKDQYVRLLRLNHMEPGEFERQQREEMVIRKVEQLVRDAVKLSEQELWDTFRLEEEKIKLTCLAFDPRQYEAHIKPSERQLQEYFQRHGDAFKTPERRRMLCAVFEPGDYQHEVQILTGDIEDYYDSHRDEYSHAEEINLRHLLIKADPNEERGRLEEKRKKIEGLLERIHKGEDFAQLAKTYSEDKTAKEGGSLGYVKKGDLVPDIDRVAFSMKPGEVSGIVSSPYGLHILKVEDYRKATVDPLEEVKSSIQEALQKEKARVLTRRKAEEYLWRVKEKGGPGMVPGQAGGDKAPVRETGYFGRGESIPGIGIEEALTQTAFSLAPGEVSDVIKGNKGFYVIKVLEKKEPVVPPYEEVSKEVVKAFVAEESKVLAQRKAEEVLAQVRKGKAIEEVAKQEGVQLFETEWFNRMANYVPKLGSSQELKETAFSLTRTDPFPKSPIEIGGIFYIIRFKEGVQARKEAFDSQEEALLRVEEEKKRNESYRAWLAALRTMVEIKISSAEL